MPKNKPNLALRIGVAVFACLALVGIAIGNNAYRYLHPITTQPVFYRTMFPLSSWQFGPSPDVGGMRTMEVIINTKTGKASGDPWLHRTRFYGFGIVGIAASYREYSPDPLD